MSWVGVQYSRIPLTEIMNAMRIWFDSRRYHSKTFEYVISEFGVLVRVEFAEEAQAAEFAEAFGGFTSRDRPSPGHTHEIPTERARPLGVQGDE